MAKQMSPGASSGSSFRSNTLQQLGSNGDVVASKRNNLRDLAAEDLGIGKVYNGPQSKSEQAQTLAQDSRHAFRQHNSTGPTSGQQQLPPESQSILNTPLASAMKKVGMIPTANNHLNEFLKKKVVPVTSVMYSSTSNSASPRVMSSMNEDGTGGQSSSMDMHMSQRQMDSLNA